MKRIAAVLMVLALGSAPLPATAQSDPDEPPVAELEGDLAGQRLTPDEARRLLAETPPSDPDARYALLQRQLRAAQQLEDRPRQIALARQLVDAGRGRAGGEAWVRVYLVTEYVWGSSGRALEASEAFVTDRKLSLPTRAGAALRQTYYAAHGNDRAALARLWARADGLARDALKEPGAPATLAIDRLQTRAEVERFTADPATVTATLREAVSASRKLLQPLPPAEQAELYGWLDGSLGMLTYALVRQGRAQEAIEIARGNIALWRAGQLSDGLGARWNYRLATSLIATQQYEPGLAAARLSDEMLARAGVLPASHTRWLARQEIVRGLIGLARWAEADAEQRRYLDEVAGDALARTRASDWRLTALLAARTGRLDEALEVVERIHRLRLRLYGAEHPQTHEAVGVRAFVRLARGDLTQAIDDYEQLFVALLDRPGGWRDLDLRGLRGYVLGVAIDEFLAHVVERALKREPIAAPLAERALQIAERRRLGTTQRALADSTARLLAATPALRAQLEAEQQQRQAAGASFASVSALLGDEERLRREVSGDAFKALPPARRKERMTELHELRGQIKARQAEAQAARRKLDEQREAIAREFPAYADLVTPAMPRIAALRALLSPGEALLVVHPLERATLMWLLTANEAQGPHASALTHAQLGAKVTELRAALDLSAARRAPALPLARLHELYRELLGPFEPRLGNVDSLIVASSGPLAALPLAALVTEAPGRGAPAWLVRRMAVSQLPSAAALQALRRVGAPPLAARPLFGFGDPAFRLDPAAAPASAGPAAGRGVAGRGAGRYDAAFGFRYADVPPLPDTRTELLAVAAALGADPRSDLLLGAAATRRAVLAAPLADRRVVAFATHGLMPGEIPGVARPALAMAADVDDGESPLLELDDVLNLRLNAQWVLLSACNTAAAAEAGAGSEGAMSGLVRGFFFAGARSVLATHWAVDSASAAALSAATFEQRGAASRADSLRRAQLAMLDGKLGQGRWTHPYHWAPYALFGDPAR